MKNTDKKDWAYTLFLTGNFNQKQIAVKVGTTEKTLSKWVNDGRWDDKRKSLLTNKKEQLAFLYDQLDAIKTDISNRPEGSQHANSKDADSILKLTAAIKNLETDTGLGEIIEVFTLFIKWLSRDDLEMAQKVSPLMDAFLQEKTD